MRTRSLIAPLLLLAGCSAKGPAIAPRPPLPDAAAESVDGFLAMCIVAGDLPAAVHEKLVIVGRLTGSSLSTVESDADVELPESDAWSALSGGGSRTGQVETIRDGNVAVVSVGHCPEDGALWSTLPLQRVPRPEGEAADALDQRIADRRAASEGEAVGNVETSFTERRVEWLVLADAPERVFRVTTIETGLVECEPPAEPGADSVCGSLEETKIIVESTRDGSSVEAAETLVASVGC